MLENTKKNEKQNQIGQFLFTSEFIFHFIPFTIVFILFALSKPHIRWNAFSFAKA